MHIDTIETFEAMQDRAIARELQAQAKRRAYMKRDTVAAAMKRAEKARSLRSRVARFFGL